MQIFLTFAELYPKVFDGLSCGTFAVDYLEVSVYIVGSDVVICGVKVH